MNIYFAALVDNSDTEAVVVSIRFAASIHILTVNFKLVSNSTAIEYNN